MKSVASNVVISAILFSTLAVSPVLAQEPTTDPSPTTVQTTITRGADRRSPMVTKAAERKEAAITKKAEMQVTRTERREERQKNIVEKIINNGKRMIERSKEHLSRLDSIFDRVKSRIQKFEEMGKDVTKLTPLVNEAKSKHDAAQTAIGEAATTIDSLEGSSKPKDAVQTFVQTMQKVKKALRDYHAAITSVVKAMQGMSDRVSGTPHPTGVEPTITVMPTITIAPTEEPVVTP